MKIKRWVAAILIGALLCVPSALADEVREETLPEKADTLLMPTATSRQLEQDAEAAGLLKYSTVTDWSAGLTRLNAAELVAALYEKISGTEIEPVAVGTFPDCDALAVRKAVAVGLLSGGPNGTFEPDYTSMRGELAAILSRAISKCGFSTAVYEDEVPQLPSDVAPSAWYYQSVAFLCLKTGYAQPLFRPNYTATGADALEWELALYNLYNGQTPSRPTVTTWQDAGLQTEPALEGTTFFIYTPEELAWIAQKSLSGTTFVGKTVCLKADIDISTHEWVPIGSVVTGFQGDFEGGGHTISGLRVGSREWPSPLVGGFLIGGGENDDTVCNVGFTSGEVYSTSPNASVVCNAVVENCYSNVLMAEGGAITDDFSDYLTGNSYVRYHTEKNGYAGCYHKENEEVQELTDAELKSERFLQTLNDNAEERWAMWQRGADGYPVMNTQVPHPDKSWIATAQPWAVDETDPDMYLIYTPEQLAQVAHEAQLGNTFQGKTIQLMSDVSLAGKQWTPIGTEETSFRGTFDGNYHTITGLTVGAESESNRRKDAGLFDRLSSAQIRNLTLTEVSVFGADYVGGIAAVATSSTIRNCAVTGTISGIGNPFGGAGGLLGDAEGSCVLSGCFTNVNVLGAYKTGGLVGDFMGSIRDCYTMGTVAGNRAVGGLAGDGYGGTSANSYSTVDVMTKGGSAPGGLLGQGDDDRVIFTACHWSIDAIHIQDGLPISNANKRAAGSGSDSTPGNTLAELKQQGTYMGWDFDTIWAIDPEKNGGLPYLRWQSVAQQPVEGITLSKHDLTLYRGEEQYLAASISPANAADQKVTWTSSNPAVATVNEYGLVTAVDGGTTIITVTTADGGFKDSCTVTAPKRGRPVTAVIDQLLLKTESGQLLTQIPTSGSFLAEASVTVQGQPSADYYIMLAVYDTNGALCDLNYMRTRIGNSQPIAYAATIHNRPGRTIGKIKVMVLDGLSSLAPIGDAVVWGR